MPANPTPVVVASLCQLAAQSGVLWSGLLDRSNPGLLTFNPDGSVRPSSPSEGVLIEAIMTASSALSNRIGLDSPTDFDHRSTNGGLLIHSPDSSRCLIVCHGPAAPIPLLRLALRVCAQHLPVPIPPQIPSWQPMAPIWSDLPPELGQPPVLAASDHSVVYNPFNSA